MAAKGQDHTHTHIINTSISIANHLGKVVEVRCREGSSYRVALSFPLPASSKVVSGLSWSVLLP